MDSKIRRGPRAQSPAPQYKYGDRLGEYIITGFAGVGATSFVYKARHETSFEPVAIKVLHPHLLEDEIKRTRFIREAQMMMSFEHPNVVQFIRILDGDNLSFVMEFIEGDTLEEWLEKHRGTVTQEEVLAMFVDLLRGLNHAHRRGIVHRDLKPANILVTLDHGRFVAKIIDFGVARFLDMPTTMEDRTKIVGTAAYISPEEVRDPDTVCHASDIYSIGVMLYEAVCGKRPFEGLGVKELMKAHVAAQPEKPTDVNPELTPALEKVILRSLAKTPENRYGSVPQLIDAIEGATRDQWAANAEELFEAKTAEWDRSRQKSVTPEVGVRRFFRHALGAALTFLSPTNKDDAHYLDRVEDSYLPL